MFFKLAKKRKLISENPFQETSAPAGDSSGRQHFVTEEDAGKLLSVANPTWRTILGLCRFGGLRCPSEVLSLRWEDILWDSQKIVVTSPKTEHHEGKGSRVIPLFSELLPILLESSELAEDRAEYVVGGNYREAAQGPNGWQNCNLRTQFERIIKRAGLAPWPRMFPNLRASRETELVKKHPVHVVVSWMGNTPRVAMKHYLQVTDEDFRKATEKSGA
ncbi:MAG: tyrosine-type recombinase/integrase, partial [Planctomycetaceae bacterium]|nr:tyrosine-type recombinase/integrase [Planctomycetaceae bacterium]